MYGNRNVMVLLDSVELAVWIPKGVDFYIDLKALKNLDVLQDLFQA